MAGGMIAFLFAVLLQAVGSAPETYLEAARRAEAAGDFRSAEQAYENYLAVRSEPDVWQRLGLVRHLENKFAEAIPAFEKAVRAKPDLWSAHLFLSIDLYRTNRFQEALDHLQKAARLRPNDDDIQFWLGATDLALKRYLEGLTILERLAMKQPENLEVIRLLAQSYAEYSTRLADDVAERYPETPAGYHVHGQALEFEGAYDAALTAYRMALRLQPDRPGIRLAIARVLLAEGKVREGIEPAEQAVHELPFSEEAHRVLISAYEATGRTEESARENARWAALRHE